MFPGLRDQHCNYLVVLFSIITLVDYWLQKCEKLNTSLTEEAGNTDQECEHRVKKRAPRKNDRIP